jgi:hypothetical protein
MQSCKLTKEWTSLGAEYITDFKKVNQDSMRIAFLVPWFTPVRYKFDAFGYKFWIQSAASNRNIADFFMIHDNRTIMNLFMNEHEHETNIKYIHTQSPYKLFKNITPKIRDILMHTNKVSNFRPAHGHMFEHLLHDYTHWGWVDTDTILGDLSQFFGGVVATKDIISVNSPRHICLYPRWMFAGQMTVFKNTPLLRNVFSKDNNWYFKMHNDAQYEETSYASFMKKIANSTAFLLAQENDHQPPTCNWCDETVHWRNGTLTVKQGKYPRHVALIHLRA